MSPTLTHAPSRAFLDQLLERFDLRESALLGILGPMHDEDAFIENGAFVGIDISRVPTWIADFSTPFVLDLDGLDTLRWFNAKESHLSALRVGSLPALRHLECDANYIKDLDLSGVPALKHLSCSGNQLNALDLSACPALRDINANKNHLTSLALPEAMHLETLLVMFNKLSELRVHAPELRQLLAQGNPLRTLDVSGCPMLERLTWDTSQETLVDTGDNPRMALVSGP